MKILLKDHGTGLYLGRGREWTKNPEKARAFRNRFRASAYRAWHRLPRACVVSVPGENIKPRYEARAVIGSGSNGAGECPSIVEARLDLGPGNALFIRGQGGGLEWTNGQRLEHTDHVTWVWKAPRAGDSIIFQLLLNDLIWAKGDDVLLKPGATVQLVPDFEWPEIPRFSSRASRGPCRSSKFQSLAIG
jgi:hypothetical protein